MKLIHTYQTGAFLRCEFHSTQQTPTHIPENLTWRDMGQSYTYILLYPALLLGELLD